MRLAEGGLAGCLVQLVEVHTPDVLADDDCLVQVNMYGGSDESKQSAFHMESVLCVQYKAV
jgi:hypothetical protein